VTSTATLPRPEGFGNTSLVRRGARQYRDPIHRFLVDAFTEAPQRRADHSTHVHALSVIGGRATMAHSEVSGIRSSEFATGSKSSSPQAPTKYSCRSLSSKEQSGYPKYLQTLRQVAASGRCRRCFHGTVRTSQLAIAAETIRDRAQQLRAHVTDHYASVREVVMAGDASAPPAT
jgi:hypothetical protein